MSVDGEAGSVTFKSVFVIKLNSGVLFNSFVAVTSTITSCVGGVVSTAFSGEVFVSPPPPQPPMIMINVISVIILVFIACIPYLYINKVQ